MADQAPRQRPLDVPDPGEGQHPNATRQAEGFAPHGDLSGDPKQTTEKPAFDTYYDDDNGNSLSSSVFGMASRARDRFLRILPPEVTEHLVNSRKELLRAGIALAEARIESLDRAARRARDLRNEKRPS